MGVKGAFTSAGFDTSSIKRFGDQLAHISVYYEYRDQGVTQMPATISDKYVSNFKNIFDLYINDATIPKTLIGSAASGEGLVNVYRGTGRVLLAPVAANLANPNAGSGAA